MNEQPSLSRVVSRDHARHRALLARSAAMLARQYDSSQYTTAAFVEDLDEVRHARGYGRIDIDAGSFATYAALMYMRRHSHHPPRVSESDLQPELPS